MFLDNASSTSVSFPILPSYNLYLYAGHTKWPCLHIPVADLRPVMEGKWPVDRSCICHTKEGITFSRNLSTYCLPRCPTKYRFSTISCHNNLLLHIIRNTDYCRDSRELASVEKFHYILDICTVHSTVGHQSDWAHFRYQSGLCNTDLSFLSWPSRPLNRKRKKRWFRTPHRFGFLIISLYTDRLSLPFPVGIQ